MGSSDSDRRTTAAAVWSTKDPKSQPIQISMRSESAKNRHVLRPLEHGRDRLAAEDLARGLDELTFVLLREHRRTEHAPFFGQEGWRDPGAVHGLGDDPLPA